MSVAIMAKVWERAFESQTAKTIALKLADHADDDGQGIYPANDSIAIECQCGLRTVQRTIKAFLDMGLLVMVREGGRGPGVPNEYDMNLAVLEHIPLHEVAQRRLEYRERKVRKAEKPTQNKGATVTPLAENKGATETHKGATDDIKGCHGGTQTINKPLGTSLSAQGACEDAACAAEREAVDDDPKKVEQDFKRFFPTWPTYVSDSEGEARKQWFLLSPDDRQAAVARKDDYLAAVKASERKMVCSCGRYLSEKRWERLPEAAAKIAKPQIMKPHGKTWNAVRQFSLTQETRKPWKPTAFMQTQINQGKGHVFDADRLRAEFPRVAEMDACAENEKAMRVPPDIGGFDTCDFVQVMVGSREWEAWQAWHGAMDYPLMPTPRGQERWAWLPSALPPVVQGLGGEDDYAAL